MVPTLPSSYHAGYINSNIEVTQCGLKSTRHESVYCNEHRNEYNVTCNEVKVLKNGLNFTSLNVKVFLFFNTSLKVKVLKLLLKYSNALLLLRYCTTLQLLHCQTIEQHLSNARCGRPHGEGVSHMRTKWVGAWRTGIFCGCPLWTTSIATQTTRISYV